MSGAPAVAPAAAVAFTRVTVRAGGRDLLDDLTFSVPRGQRVALIGPSGAGKTTLLRLVAGLAWPAAGTVRVLDSDTASWRGRTLRAMRRRIGFLHQHDNLVPQLRVAHNVLMGRLGAWSLPKALWSLLRPQELERAAAALARVELADRLWALPDELSGGERQRVAIARLLLQAPELVLADEPSSALDARLGREVVRRVLELPGDGTVLVALHALELLDLGFDRVLALRDGRIVFDGHPAGLDRTTLRAVYGVEFDRVAGSVPAP